MLALIAHWHSLGISRFKTVTYLKSTVAESLDSSHRCAIRVRPVVDSDEIIGKVNAGVFFGNKQFDADCLIVRNIEIVILGLLTVC